MGKLFDFESDQAIATVVGTPVFHRKSSIEFNQETMCKKGKTMSDLITLIENNPAQVAALIDHTLLKPTATEAQIEVLCQEAMQHNFASVCINPTHVKLAAQLLRDSVVKTCTVIGFPLGANTTPVKVFETKETIKDGAEEVDMVINIGALKQGNNDLVEQDIAAVVGAAHRSDVLCKVIIETCFLNDEEKARACRLAQKAGADFVKTSTGFGGGGATVEDVALMRQTVGPTMGVKASGGVKNFADAKAMVAVGATRLGVSAGVEIVQEAS